MKKFLSFLFLTAFVSISPARAQEPIVHFFPKPNEYAGKPFMQTVHERKSSRTFSPKELDDRTLGGMMYAAWGINRPEEGRRTVPTANNRQNIDVYVIKADGAWRYEGKNHSLEKISDVDLRPLAAKQDFVKEAPVTLLYVAEPTMRSAMHAGSMYQAVGLYCASEDLNNVVRLMVDADSLATALNLKKGQTVIVSQTVGLPPMSEETPAAAEAVPVQQTPQPVNTAE